MFLLEYDGKYQAWTAYKEAAASGSNAFKVGTYYHTDWLPEDELPLKVEGLSVDKVYENFVRQIAGDALRAEDGKTESLKESVERDTRRQELEKQIADIGSMLKKSGASSEIRNMVTQIIKYYTDFQNNHVKHNDAVNGDELEYVIELTSVIMKFLIKANGGN